MDRVQGIVRKLGADRLVGVAGFSLGGLMSLNLALSLGRGSRLPVWLFDTYSPRMGLEHFWRKVERNIAWRVWGGRPPAGRNELGEALGNIPEEFEARAKPEAWEAFKVELAYASCAAGSTPVHLVQATDTINRAAYVLRRATNGFVRRHYAAWQQTVLKGDHAELTSRLSGDVADLVSRQLRGGS